MDPLVFGAVLAAAAMHAGWNALLKVRLEPFLGDDPLTACAGVIGVPLLARVRPAQGGRMALAVAGSVALHLGSTTWR